jgi:hypothetical protein
VLPIADGGKLTEEMLLTLDQTLFQAATQSQRFECVQVSREACARLSGSRALLSTDPLPYDLFSRLATLYAADAILFVDVTDYQAYPPLSLGVRAKLARLDDRSYLWTFDQVFSAAVPAVANAARRHWLGIQPPGTPGDMSANVLQSPIRFAAYAFSASFGTMPPRLPAKSAQRH